MEEAPDGEAWTPPPGALPSGPSDLVLPRWRPDRRQVNAKYADAAGALVELKRALLQTDAVTEGQKLDAVADIDTIETPQG